MNAIRVGWLLAVLSLGPSWAGAGVIRGMITPASPRTLGGLAGNRHSGTTAVWRNNGQDVVVYLEQVPAGLEKKLARNSQPVSIAQARGRFMPSPMTIAAGTTVIFENHDSVYHNVFSVSSAKRFNIGKYGPTETRSVRFERPGLIKLFCDIDPAELGYLLVTPNHAYARPDSTGAFALPKLPSGTYRLRVWCSDRRQIARNVEMPRHGDVSLDLRL